LRLASLGLVDHIELRTAAIDAALVAAAARGVAQLVILGAGLDARAWRMPELAAAVVFEIDHPATQGKKRAWMQAAVPRARDVRFVSVDFERDALGERLAEVGHERTAPTAWVWEGVTPYLSRAALHGTLGEVGRASAPGSMLAVTYMTPDLIPFSALRGVATRFFHALGEPLIGGITPEELGQEIASVGFVRRADGSNFDWAGPDRARSSRARLFACERLAVCDKR
jgi:methyltransferase (TIGR00027 family)